MILSSLIKRLAQLEARQVSISTAPKRLIATALQVPSDPTLNGTHSVSGNVVTFHNKTLSAAFEQRQVWLSEQPAGVVVMVSPFESGRRVLDVLAERHADDS